MVPVTTSLRAGSYSAAFHPTGCGEPGAYPWLRDAMKRVRGYVVVIAGPDS
jgi:hypothetical protein